MYFCRLHKSRLTKTIKYKGADVVYSQSGSGQTILLLHGFLEDRHMWDELAANLEGEFNIVRLDLLGQGESGNIGYVHSIEEQAEVAMAVLQDLEVTTCVVVGHSMGGYIALAFAEKYADKVKGVILLHSTAYPDSDERKKDRERVIDLVQRNKQVYTKTVIPSLFSETFRKANAEQIQNLIDIANSYSTQGIIANIRGMMDRVDRADVLKKGNYPKLIIHGTQDPIISASDMEALASLNDNCRLEVIQAIGHMGHLEATTTTQKLIRDFCNN